MFFFIYFNIICFWGGGAGESISSLLIDAQEAGEAILTEKRHGIPSEMAYQKLINAYGRLGKAEEALLVFEDLTKV